MTSEVAFWITVVGGPLLVTGVGASIKMIVSLSSRVTRLEAQQEPMIKAVDEMRADLKAIDQKLQRMLGSCAHCEDSSR